MFEKFGIILCFTGNNSSLARQWTCIIIDVLSADHLGQ